MLLCFVWPDVWFLFVLFLWYFCVMLCLLSRHQHMMIVCMHLITSGCPAAAIAVAVAVAVDVMWEVSSNLSSQSVVCVPLRLLPCCESAQFPQHSVLSIDKIQC